MASSQQSPAKKNSDRVHMLSLLGKRSRNNTELNEQANSDHAFLQQLSEQNRAMKKEDSPFLKTAIGLVDQFIAQSPSKTLNNCAVCSNQEKQTWHQLASDVSQTQAHCSAHHDQFHKVADL